MATRTIEVPIDESGKVTLPNWVMDAPDPETGRRDIIITTIPGRPNMARVTLADWKHKDERKVK